MSDKSDYGKKKTIGSHALAVFHCGKYVGLSGIGQTQSLCTINV